MMNVVGWKLGIASLGLALGVTGVGAARTARQAGPVQTRLQQAARELGLTPAQRAQLRGMAVHAFVESASCHMENVPPEERAERLFATRKEFFAGVERVLTPAQRTRAKAMWETRRPQVEAAVETRLAKAAERLDVTPEQKERLEAIATETRAELDRLQKDPTLDDPTRLAKGLAALEEGRDRGLVVLTPEQRAQVRKAIEQRINAALPRVAGL